MELFKNRTRVAYTNAVGDKVYPVIVDIKRGIKSTEEIQFMSSDINTGILSVAFIQGNDNYNVTGADVVCSVMRPDASTLELPCDIVGDNVVEVPLGINGTSQDGIYSFDFKVFKGGNKVVGTPIMNYSVSLSISNDMVVEEDDRLPVLTVLMTQITALKNETKDVISTANTAIQNANKATDNTKLAISNAQSATQEAEDVIARVNNAIASGTQDLEVKEARDGETSLKARLDRDIEKAKEIYIDVEGSYISTDSSSGYLKDVEILGNTVQNASNLADIRSVGDKVEGQELYEIPVLSCGKNLASTNNIFVDGNIDAVGIVGSYPQDACNVTDCIKVKPNTNYIRNIVSDFKNTTGFYDANKNFISRVFSQQFTTPSNCMYVRVKYDKTKDLQLEEGTVATEYEPYQEDKITILSPVQLEKVGDVADRIICKDGVWGVDKNVNMIKLNGTESGWFRHDTGKFYEIPIVDIQIPNKVIICNKYKHMIASTGDTTGKITTVQHKAIRIYPLDYSELTLDLFKQRLSKDNVLVKYPTTNPQFIPLPHSQQVKLRTFANKTNISFLTEIEGTIKAQVPKSLGATVNTHTEQISNLNKELDRVKKLEESTVSTVETESDFTTVEATSNGYFEDVKLEGKTLVNYISNFNNWSNMGSTTVSDDGSSITINATAWNKGRQISKILPSGYYIFSINNPNNATIVIQNKNNTKTLFNGNNADINFEFSLSEESEVWITCKNTSETGTYVISNPILTTERNFNTYFEGLKSVGQGTDEIVVSSVKGDGNLFDATLDTQTKNGVTFSYDGATGEVVLNGTCTANNTSVTFKYPPKFIKGNKYYLRIFGTTINSPLAYIRVYDDKYVGNNLATTSRETSIHNSSSTRKMVNTSIRVDSGVTFNNFRFKVQLTVNEDKVEYTPYQSDKKQLLFYNEETQTWEKPILREWDSIEKHADGKYYYHQRSGEVVLNGSENWSVRDDLPTDNPQGTHLVFYVQDENFPIKARPNDTSSIVWISDIIQPLSHTYGWNTSVEGLHFGTFNKSQGTNNCRYYINITKSKLSTQDVQGFKQWLQANNVTVVYQLAEEKVYECTNIDLVTYANETNYIVESGVISPKSILKVHNNISNVVKILQEKVSLLENKFIEGLKQVLAGDMYSLAELLYPEDFKEIEAENSIMLIPLE